MDSTGSPDLELTEKDLRPGQMLELFQEAVGRVYGNQGKERNPADLIGLIYRRRWTIQLFFRWIKCILGCRHFFADSPQGVAIQLYLALIASLLFQFYTGRHPASLAPCRLGPKPNRLSSLPEHPTASSLPNTID